MEALTTLINVDIDMAPKLVSFIANTIDDADTAGSFSNACTDLIETSQTEALLRKIIDHTEDIIAYDRESDAEGCFQALVSILFSIGDAQKSLSIVKYMTENICANKTKSKLRVKILVTLFNLLTNKKEKYEVVRALLKYGSDNNLSHIVSQLSEKIEQWIQLWGLNVSEERELLRLIVEILSKSNQELQSRKFLVRFLHTYGSDDFPEDVLDIAVNAALTVVKSPASAIADRNVVLEGLSKQRNKSVDLNTLVSLLRILCTGRISEFRSFYQSNSSVLQRLGVDQERTLHTMRLMTLCASMMGRQKVHYADIASAIEVDLSEVEDWIVEAISDGLMDATMDQTNSIVTISRCFHGSFGQDQWLQMHAKLLDWRRSVSTVASALKAQAAKDNQL